MMLRSTLAQAPLLSFFLSLISHTYAAQDGLPIPAVSLGGLPASPLELVSAESGESLVYRGPVGSPIEGIEVKRRTTSRGQDREVFIEVSSKRRVVDLQLVQSIELDLDWRSYVVAPGAMYSGNRFIVSPQPYAPFLLTEGVSPNGPVVIADIPRLTSDRGYRAEFAANALSIPTVGVFDETKSKGMLVAVDVYGEWGVTGVNLVTLPSRPVTVEVALPVRRSSRYRFCDWVKTDEVGMNLEPGVVMSTVILVRSANEPDIPSFVSRIAEYGAETRGSESRRGSLGLTEAARLVEAKLNAHNWDEAEGYYTSTMDNSWKLQTGWVGGGVTFYAMITSDNPLSQERGVRMMDTICRSAVTPSGYFHGLHKDGKWQSFGAKREGCRAFSMIRRPIECARDVLKSMAVLRERGERIDPAWEIAAKANLDAMVTTIREYGHLGYTVDFDTGKILWGGTTTGAFGIEALILGERWFNEPAYLAAAERLSEHAVRGFVHRGITLGGVGDALMAADSESSYALLSGLVALHARTGRPEHLVWARQSADLFSTWVLSYDAVLPPDSALGKLGIQARGAVFANTQNQHGAPGICTASGLALLQLYELTGEERYLRTLEDIVACSPQMVVRSGQEWIWKSMPPGTMSERLMTMDGMEPTGATEALSTWAEIALLHMARELPPTFRSERWGHSATFSNAY